MYKCGGGSNEENIPAKQEKDQVYSWLQSPYGYCGRTQGPGQTPCQGQKGIICLRATDRWFFLRLMKKINRVKKKQEFQKLINTGKKSANHSFVMYLLPKSEDQARVGITLSRKIGNAVQRNLIKRQVRMMCQDLICFDNFPYDCILIVRFGFKEHDFESNKNNLEKLLRKATM